jgi:hypothetical protein
MLLKRHFAKPDGWQPQKNLRLPNGQLMVPSLGEGDCLNPPPLAHVELKHTGATAQQKFSEDLIAAALREGWARFDGAVLILDVKPEPLRYAVLRTPGRYCLHCAERLPDNDAGGEQARAHVAEKHAGEKSPDPSNPAGYEAIHCYECELDSALHARHSQAAYERKRKGKA